MFSINNFYNTEQFKRFCYPGSLIAGAGAKDFIKEIVPFKNAPGLILVDRYFRSHSFIEELAGNSPVISVSKEPDTSFVNSIISELPAKVEWIIAVGGGSTIDTAKAIKAFLLFGNFERIGYGDYRYVSDQIEDKGPVLVAVPTTAASGAECSRYYLLFNSQTGEKTVSRSWKVVPNYALLDPVFLQSASMKQLTVGAFDAFIHLWETYTCRFESSPLIDCLCREGISRICAVLWMPEGPALASTDLLSLQHAAALGGIALSNVRTGMIHGAGEALASESFLPHPQSLYVFFEQALSLYGDAIQPKLGLLLDALKNVGSGSIQSLSDIIGFWNARFAKTDVNDQIKKALTNLSAPVRSRIVDKLLADKVLLTKESPVPLSEELVAQYIRSSLDNFLPVH